MFQWQIIFMMYFCWTVHPYKRSTVSQCLWHNYTCVEYCPDWMIERTSNCTQTYWLAQRTCDNPQRMLVGTVCGFSRCDCPDPKVLDTDTGFCYDVENCPTKHTE